MQTDTGELMSLEEMKKRIQEKPNLANKFVEIPSQYLPQLEGMNRKERRRWYSQNKKLFRGNQ